jgi:hypothetical protein
MILRFVREIPNNALANDSAALAKSASVIHHRKADLEPFDGNAEHNQADESDSSASGHHHHAYHLT